MSNVSVSRCGRLWRIPTGVQNVTLAHDRYGTYVLAMDVSQNWKFLFFWKPFSLSTSVNMTFALRRGKESPAFSLYMVYYVEWPL